MNLIRSSLCGGRVVRVEVGRERHRGRAVMVGGGGQSKAKQSKPTCMHVWCDPPDGAPREGNGVAEAQPCLVASLRKVSLFGRLIEQILCMLLEKN